MLRMPRCFLARLVAATEAAGVVADGRDLQAATPEIDPCTTQPAQLPRSEPGADEDQEDALIFGEAWARSWPDRLGV
jgi:hypothetical protein